MAVDPEDVEVERAYVNTIAELKARTAQAEAELIAHRREMGMPEACGQLGCDPKYSNLRCGRPRGHDGAGNAWSLEVVDAQREWRAALEKRSNDKR